MAANYQDELKALDELFHNVGRFRSSEDFLALLEFVRKFRNIAPYNAFLLHVQKPGSQFVATAVDWKRKFNRSIKVGARPLITLFPFGPVRFVYELGDTEGEDFPEELLKPFKTAGTLPDALWSLLMTNLPRECVFYAEADHGTGSAGFIRGADRGKFQLVKDKKVPVLYELVVNGNHSTEEKFATIAHELGHLYCGHLGSPDPSWWTARTGLPLNVKEFEAESVAWLVCERVGVKNPSEQYLRDYLGNNGEIPPVSLEAIFKAALRVESMTKRTLSIRKLPEKKSGRAS
ncbi:ImmA/IrrE family metallo-endopeptidase [Granulosicoccaceae sp. 1_MG-2023]|nr:ImmA/IrrE family metallo-endopeptidase [Granulosicoccaceae sp. 1_MG-2023]